LYLKLILNRPYAKEPANHPDGRWSPYDPKASA
jgi:hypothetical protein